MRGQVIRETRALAGTAEAVCRDEGMEWLSRRTQGMMPTEAVVVHAPSGAFQAPGGGENQLLQTSRAVEERGWRIRPLVPWTDRLARARLLHLYGMSREGLELAKLARGAGVPVVLSPICWVEGRAIRALAANPARSLMGLAALGARRLSPRAFGWRAELLGLSDAILPNSEAEADQLVRLYGARRDRIEVVPNGVDPRFAGADPGLFRERFGGEPFVLYVGRVEPRKNVLGLVEGVRRLGHRLVVIGDTVPGHEGYAATCRAAGGVWLRWLPRLAHDSPLLESAYAAARVFALPSWFETPGLAALEAGLAGTAVVITPYGCTREYFGELAYYVRPGRVEEIARGIDRAWVRGCPAELPGRIESRYPWREVGRLTARVYERLAS